ncbi:MAG: amidohydrolase family protein [Methylococcaceae bacterium]
MFKGPVLEPSQLLPTDIIDAHVHVAGIGAKGSGCFISEDISSSYKLDYYLQSFNVSREELESKGDQVVVQKLATLLKQSKTVQAAVVLALDGVVDDQGQLDLSQSEIYIPNDFVSRETSRFANLYFGASINPYRNDALKRLDQVKQQGAKLIKWIPSIQNIDPADEKIIPFYQKMKKLGLPLLSHTGKERSFTKSKDDLADPLRLELPLKLGVTVIAAHVATTGSTQGQDNVERIMPLFDKYPNLYADVSTLTQINKLGYFDQILPDQRVKGRLIYGSDFPLINTLLVSPYFFPLNLTFQEMNRIANIPNVWDRDVALKQSLGMPADIFSATRKLFNIN